jgi:Fe-S cluster assembly protein SufD
MMETTLNIEETVNKFSDFYHSSQDNFITSKFIKALKDNAIESFIKNGFPEKKSEKYKYTNLEPFFKNDYTLLLQPDNFTFDVNDVFKCEVPDLNTDVVLLVNGFYYHKNMINGQLPNGIWIGSLAKAIVDKPELIQNHLDKITGKEDGIAALNTALFLDGIFIYLPKNTILEKPLQIINVLLSDENLMVHQRNLIVLDENSKANIVVCDHTLSSKSFLTNSVTEVFAGKAAHFEQTCLQNEHNDAVKITNTFVHQEQNSSIASSTITLHGGLVRNNMEIVLDGKGAENKTSGLFLTDKTQHVDNYVFINHNKPECTSNQLFKGVLDDGSTGAFTGRILVSRDAQKTMAYQKNNNLLLTADAKMHTRPQLEIYADDVKCSHGATVGQLDQEAMFYLRSRGISKEEARLLLMFAFTHEIIDQIQVQPLKERIDELVNKRLRGELTRCHNCAIHCC